MITYMWGQCVPGRLFLPPPRYKARTTDALPKDSLAGGSDFLMLTKLYMKLHVHTVVALLVEHVSSRHNVMMSIRTHTFLE